MTSNKKEIKINPDLFVMRGAKKRDARKTAKVSTPRSLKSGSIKKALMRKIKSNRSRTSPEQGSDDDPAYADDMLTSSLKYLDSISSSSNVPVSLDIPAPVALGSGTGHGSGHSVPGMIRISTDGGITPPPPPYGCLKGGNKSTYRQWKQTQKNRDGMDPPTETIQILPGTPPSLLRSGGESTHTGETPIASPPRISIPDIPPIAMGDASEPSRKAKLQAARDRYKSQQKIAEKQYATFGKQKGGKNKTAKRISVLIKDNKTLKKIEHEKNMLGGHAMPKVRSYLKSRGLIKVGTTAPDEIIKELYKNAYLAGNIHNKNSDVLLHNYMAKEDV